MKVFLLGLPGSGKTTLGKQLAERLQRPFIDLDSEIEKDSGCAIQELFSRHGEEYFRDLESRILESRCKENSDFVMATGGGTPCFRNNLSLILRSGRSLFLDVPVETIASRIHTPDLSERPLLASLEPAALISKLRSMRSERVNYYSKADVVLTGSDITVKSLLENIA